jgi:ATP-dependent DNA helicase RecG
VGDLDIVAFREFRRKALASKRLSEEDLEMSDLALVDSLLLADGNYLKRAAILLFHETPERWVTGAYVKIGYFETGADLLYMDEVHGSLVTMADKVLDIIYTKYFKGMVSYEGIQRVETYPVPRAACREAILNAIVHRDYGTGVPIQIKVFPDKVIIYNDGGLPEGWTVSDLLSRRISVPHNPNIANAFFRSGQVETWGRGIEKIETACKNESKPAPVFLVSATSMQVTFFVPVADISVTSKVTEKVTEEVTEKVTETESAVLSLIRQNGSITQTEMASHLAVSRKTIASRLKSLKEKGVIQRVGSDTKGGWEILE